jgi:16S rRNA (cytosine967-C5)-methyltransferase
LRAVASGAPFADARDRHVAGLPDRDRRLAHALAAGVLRHRAALDRLIDLSRADGRVHDILRLGLLQLRELERVPAYAAVATSVALAREAAGVPAARYVNAMLRRLATDPARPDAGGSHPEWLALRWRRRFGAEETARLLAWNDRQPPLVLQPARWSQAELAERLREAGYEVTAAPAGAGLQVIDALGRAPRPTTLPGFAEGGFFVQAAGPALVCRFAALPAGASIYDACAAPGGKAVALARDGGRVVAGELHRARLPRLMETVERCGGGTPVLADVLAPPFAPGSFDAVLLDAPCTATGVMARHPDARWRITERAIARSAERQRALLASAANIVRPGGVLVYATCSLEPEENADVVNTVLARRPDLRRAPVPGAVPAEMVTPAGDFETLPQRHGTDGAYAARLVRVG